MSLSTLREATPLSADTILLFCLPKGVIKVSWNVDLTAGKLRSFSCPLHKRAVDQTELAEDRTERMVRLKGAPRDVGTKVLLTEPEGLICTEGRELLLCVLGTRRIDLKLNSPSSLRE